MNFRFAASTDFWRKFWYRWLLAIFLAWLIPELLSLVVAYMSGQPVIQTWTLSDTIRRWAAEYRWVAPIVVGTIAGLVWHFFVEKNKQ